MVCFGASSKQSLSAWLWFRGPVNRTKPHRTLFVYFSRDSHQNGLQRFTFSKRAWLILFMVWDKSCHNSEEMIDLPLHLHLHISSTSNHFEPTKAKEYLLSMAKERVDEIVLVPAHNL